MKRRPLNSATLATATHKELIRVFDRTGAQVGVWMINKWRVLMIGEGLYNIKESPKRGGRENRKEGIQEQNPAVRIYAHE